ncbi:MAG: hypothetical protein UY21_C0017G0001 [Microgenomates group bacterium GW2011_GWA1_48_10]|uniref:Uncharacterized protein n=1 Tax=Candidatus Gottesmanbacteria bacterium RIFCSPHIGHO2_01_FULL_47_48 TaxID=1798381 RepID=A0A1F6A379_9BACT|nr:MAG: hypothetical protein UY21_C0017G0001 [Microgenomates group bacterium GW2011_GWA1_48_10]OGG19171.1 MAG: hypothetical protein A2721_02005 [Candidatus Gottesmanbacteria bacterium RIFCSPHIGHO2_01_FULL_47_48]
MFKEYLNESLLLNVRPVKEKNQLEFSYSIRHKDPQILSAFTQALGKLKAVSNVEIVSVQRDIEY